MKKALLMMLLLCAVLAGQVGQGKSTVAVYMSGVEPKGALGAHEIMGGELVKAISRSDKYSAINRTEAVQKLLAKEHTYTRNGAVTKDGIRAIGKQLGVQYLCAVKITDVKGGSFYVAVELVDVESAETIHSATEESSLNNGREMLNVAKQLAKDLTGVDLGTWTAGKSAGTVDRDFNDEKTGINMVLVQGGTTVVGCGNISESRTEYSGECAKWLEEHPKEKLTLKDYYISRYEITQEEWVKVMGSNPSHFQGRVGWESLPVENVSYGDVQAFIVKLNAMTGRKYRLPSFIEWYFAAYGGVKSKGYNYIGSDNIRDVAWYKENSNNETHRVGQRAPNELRLYDMAGNVWEFVSPPPPPREEGYGFVGGGWGDDIVGLKTGIYMEMGGDPKGEWIGFRLALDP